MRLPSLIRSLLFVPGNRPDRMKKAMDAGADGVIFDLEDAVPLSEKARAREFISEMLMEGLPSPVVVRVNAIETGLIQEDIKAAVRPGLSAVILPKVEEPNQLVDLSGMLLVHEQAAGIQRGSVEVIPLIESARAIQNLYAVLTTPMDPPRLRTVAFGAADFALDMAIELTKNGEELHFPRYSISMACRAAGLHPPLDTPYMVDIRDMKGLEEDAMRAKRLGFQGKLCVHPSQVDVCNRVFSPSEEEIIWAKKIIAAFEEAQAKGSAAVQVEGRFVDIPVVSRARKVVETAQRLGLD
jgi:citrate lyase subunit beta/citryl-CoA lyase